FVGFGGNGDADFGCRDDVYVDLVLIENVEDRFQIPVHQQSARRGYVYDSNFFLQRDSFEDIGTAGGAGRDPGAFAGWILRIQNVNRNVLLNGGQHRGRMQDLGAEVGEFGSFVEADHLDAAGVGAEPGVGGHHAVDIGPDFDAGRVKAGTKNG